jgi:hypothetical protein
MAVQYADEQLLQGTIYSGKSCEFDFGYGPVEGVLKAGGSSKRTRKIVPGSRRDGKPVGKTAGKFEPGSLTFALLGTSAKQFETYLANQSSGSYGDTDFTLVVSMYEPDINNDVPITITFVDCSIEEPKEQWDEGIEENVTEYTCQFLSSDKNTNVLWSQLRST